MMTALEELPGYELVIPGLRDVAAGKESPEAQLIAIGAPRLRRMGLSIPPREQLPDQAELRLYRLLGESGVRDPYSAYNALIRRLVRFERALEHAQRQWLQK